MNPAALLRLARPDRPDGELLAAFAEDRDEAAFAELVRRHGPLVWGVCRRMLPNPADAEDAFQAAFLVLVRRADRLTAAGTVGPWLHRVAVLTARDLRKRAARRAVRLCPLPADLPAPPVPQSDVDDLLLGLPDRYRAAVVLCCLEGLTQREAAARLGVPEGTLSARLSRGLAKLRARWAGTLPAAVAVPLAVCDSTAKAATAVSLATAVSPAVLQLTEGVVRMFLLKKATAVAGLVLAVGLTVGVGSRFGPAAADDKPAADPVAKATGELDKRIAELRQLQKDLAKKKDELEAEYAKAAKWQADEIRRLQQARDSLTGKPTTAGPSAVELIVGSDKASSPYSVLEKKPDGDVDLSAAIHTEAALVRHLRRLKTDPAAPKSITLSTAKEAPWARTQAAIDAIKAAGFEQVMTKEVVIRGEWLGAAEDRLRAIDRQKLAAELAKLEEELAFYTQAVKKGFVTQAQLDAERVRVAELQLKLKRLDAEEKPIAPTAVTVPVGGFVQAAMEADIVRISSPSPQTVADADPDPANPRVLRVTARKPGSISLSVTLANGQTRVVQVLVTDATERKPEPIAPGAKKPARPRESLAPIKLEVGQRATVQLGGKSLKGIVSAGSHKGTGYSSKEINAHLAADKRSVVVTGRQPGEQKLVVEADDGTQAEVTVTVTE